MRRRLSEAAKERWRKRKATMQISQNQGDYNIQRASLTSQNEVAEGPSHSALTTDNAQCKHSQSAAFTSKREVSKVNNMIVRRSNRIKSLGLFGNRQGRKAVQHIDLTDCDRDKELHVEPIRGLAQNSKLSRAFSSKRKILKPQNMLVRQSGQHKSLGSFGKRQISKSIHHIDPTDRFGASVLHVEPISPEPIRNMSSTEMIVDQLVRTGGKRPFARETSSTNPNYKILYTDSEKKIEALMEENCRQAQKLYYLLGKVELYEKMIGRLMNLSRGAVKLHPDAAALNSPPAPKSSSVKKKNINVKRMKKN
ncbi:unnamed protein product [Withania somnifera]